MALRCDEASTTTMRKTDIPLAQSVLICTQSKSVARQSSSVARCSSSHAKLSISSVCGPSDPCRSEPTV